MAAVQTGPARPAPGPADDRARAEARRYRRRGLAVLAAGGVLTAAVLLGLVAAAAALWEAVTGVPDAAPPPAGVPARHATVGVRGPELVVHITIRDVATPEGSEPAYVGPAGVGAASLFSVRAGTEVVLEILNDSGMPHTFTVPSLGLDAPVAPSGVSVVRFTPRHPGRLVWFCDVPCGAWVMSHQGYMRGVVTVVAA
jgi:heme/copper-type cytochrome/quinol oxidase subunit 2